MSMFGSSALPLLSTGLNDTTLLIIGVAAGLLAGGIGVLYYMNRGKFSE